MSEKGFGWEGDAETEPGLLSRTPHSGVGLLVLPVKLLRIQAGGRGDGTAQICLRSRENGSQGTGAAVGSEVRG